MVVSYIMNKTVLVTGSSNGIGKSIIKKFASYAKGFGLEYKDLFQEGMVGLSEAINSYKDSKESKFSSFANI